MRGADRKGDVFFSKICGGLKLSYWMGGERSGLARIGLARVVLILGITGVKTFLLERKGEAWRGTERHGLYL